MLTLVYDRIWYQYKNIKKAQSNESIIAGKTEFHLYNLEKIAFTPIKIYTPHIGAIFNTFILQQYVYRDFIKAQSGDYVIDGGGCYGDTALYFSHLVGENGKVFSFEFVEENLAIFHKNIILNPHIHNISIIKRPLYDNSHTFVCFEGEGGGATINTRSHIQNQKFQTISIDDFVSENKIPRIDFIKLDIEGSELDALKGATNTIKNFKPKLAVCLYHSHRDYVEIPLFLYHLMPDYEFYFDHFTLGRWESVLFARAKTLK